MSRVIAAYDLDEDHSRLWVNANLEAMPETVIVKNIREGKEQTGTYKLRDVVSYEEGYADGFDRGQEAVMQQVDGILDDTWVFYVDAMHKLKQMSKDFWKERES